jgi:hypothetical protein
MSVLCACLNNCCTRPDFNHLLLFAFGVGAESAFIATCLLDNVVYVPDMRSNMPTKFPLLDVHLKTKTVLIARFWDQVPKTLQILTTSSVLFSPSLVRGTNGSMSQCVFFSSIDVGSPLTVCVAFPLFLFLYVPHI